MKKTTGMLLLALVAAACGSEGEDPAHDVSDDVQACKRNLRAVYGGLKDYQRELGRLPERPGAAFVGALIADGIWEDTAENRALLTCPGPGAHPPAADFGDLDALDASSTAYAGRDVVAHPLEKFPDGGFDFEEAIVACDNASGMNHDGVMNVLLADGIVVTVSLEREKERGTVPPDASTIRVGPDSALPFLRRLSSD